MSGPKKKRTPRPTVKQVFHVEIHVHTTADPMRIAQLTLERLLDVSKLKQPPFDHPRRG